MGPERARPEIPRGRADADRPFAANRLDRIGRAQHEVAFGRFGQNRIALVDPAMKSDLMALGNDAALFVGMQ